MTNTTTILSIARDMMLTRHAAEAALATGDESKAQQLHDDANMSEAFIRDRLARL
jgi:hypothetical protein